MRLATKALLVFAALPLYLLASGCTEDNVLNTGNVDFPIDVEIIDPETRFDLFSRVRITQINVRPNLPAADESLGPRPIGIIASSDDILDVNFNDPADLAPSNIILSSGPYRFSLLQMADLFFYDSDLPTLPLESCTDAQFFISPPGASGLVNLDSEDLGGVVIEVGEDTAQIIIQLDGNALANAFAASWECDLNSGIATVFHSEIFAAQAPTYIQVLQ